MFKKRRNQPVEAMNSSDRKEAIARLERERIRINFEIESVLKSYSKESGNRALKKRKYKLGNSPNDWNYREEG